MDTFRWEVALERSKTCVDKYADQPALNTLRPIPTHSVSLFCLEGITPCKLLREDLNSFRTLPVAAASANNICCNNGIWEMCVLAINVDELAKVRMAS